MDFLDVDLILCFLENGDKDVEVGDGEDDCVEGDEEEKGVDDDVDAFLSSMYKESLEEDRRRDLSISKDCDIEFVVMGEHDVVVEGRQKTLGGGDIDNNDWDDIGDCKLPDIGWDLFIGILIPKDDLVFV